MQCTDLFMGITSKMFLGFFYNTLHSGLILVLQIVIGRTWYFGHFALTS